MYVTSQIRFMYSSAFIHEKRLKGNCFKVATSSLIDLNKVMEEAIYGSKGLGEQVGRLIASVKPGRLFHSEHIDPNLWPPCDEKCNHPDTIKRRHCGCRTEV